MSPLLLLGFLLLAVGSSPAAASVDEDDLERGEPELEVTLEEARASRYVLSAHLEDDSSTQCGESGGRDIDDWEVDVEQFWFETQAESMEAMAATVARETLGGLFDESDGEFEAPLDGVYMISAYARAGTGAVDITVDVEGDEVAGFGTNLPQQSGAWSSHGVETIAFLEAGDKVTVRLRSGGDVDCVQETDFLYAQFNVELLLADAFVEDRADFE